VCVCKSERERLYNIDVCVYTVCVYGCVFVCVSIYVYTYTRTITALIRRLGLVFGSVELLSKSFMSKDVKQLGLDFPLSAPSNVKPSATQTGMDVDPSSSSSSSSNDKADMGAVCV
jgi:hypothetical protein